MVQLSLDMHIVVFLLSLNCYCNNTHRNIFWGYQTNFFGYGIVTIEMFEKKMFQIMCHMMGCNDSSG